MDDMGLSILSAKVFFKVNYSFKICVFKKSFLCEIHCYDSNMSTCYIIITHNLKIKLHELVLSQLCEF